ncbi:hypothetical protein HDU97_005563 [Phlyctochytrium planicorne]|nr:hypothetical protein HDU97_005563 [Phlyctochytrium planicorne]
MSSTICVVLSASFFNILDLAKILMLCPLLSWMLVSFYYPAFGIWSTISTFTTNTSLIIMTLWRLRIRELRYRRVYAIERAFSSAGFDGGGGGVNNGFSAKNLGVPWRSGRTLVRPLVEGKCGFPVADDGDYERDEKVENGMVGGRVGMLPAIGKLQSLEILDIVEMVRDEDEGGDYADDYDHDDGGATRRISVVFDNSGRGVGARQKVLDTKGDVEVRTGKGLKVCPADEDVEKERSLREEPTIPVADLKEVEVKFESSAEQGLVIVRIRQGISNFLKDLKTAIQQAQTEFGRSKVWKSERNGEREIEFDLWKRNSLVKQLTAKYIMSSMMEFAFAYLDMFGCLNPGSEKSLMCSDTGFVRNLRLMFAILSIAGIFIFAIKTMSAVRMVRLFIEILRSLAAMSLVFLTARHNSLDPTVELFVSYHLFNLFTSCALIPMPFPQFSLIFAASLIPMVVTLCLASEGWVMYEYTSNILNFGLLGVLGCAEDDACKRRLFSLECLLAAVRIEKNKGKEIILDVGKDVAMPILQNELNGEQLWFTEWVTVGTSLPNVSQWSLAFANRDVELSFLRFRNRSGYFMLILMEVIAFCGFSAFSVALFLTAPPEASKQMVFIEIVNAIACMACLSVGIVFRGAFTDRWNHVFITITVSIIAVNYFGVVLFLIEFTKVWKVGPTVCVMSSTIVVALASSFYTIIFRDWVRVLAFCPFLSWFLVSYYYPGFGLSRTISNFTTNLSVIIITLWRLRIRELRARRIFAIQTALATATESPFEERLGFSVIAEECEETVVTKDPESSTGAAKLGLLPQINELQSLEILDIVDSVRASNVVDGMSEGVSSESPFQSKRVSVVISKRKNDLGLPLQGKFRDSRSKRKLVDVGDDRVWPDTSANNDQNSKPSFGNNDDIGGLKSQEKLVVDNVKKGLASFMTDLWSTVMHAKNELTRSKAWKSEKNGVRELEFDKWKWNSFVKQLTAKYVMNTFTEVAFALLDITGYAGRDYIRRVLTNDTRCQNTGAEQSLMSILVLLAFHNALDPTVELFTS